MQPVCLPGAAAAVRTLRGGLGAPGADALDPLIEEIVPELGNVSLRRTVVGRLMGYGSIIIGADARTGSVIDFVPYPEQIYLEICDTIDRADHA